MQKHADRSDKRAPILNQGGGATPGPETGSHPAGGLVHTPQHLLTDTYWPKMDPAYTHAHERAAIDYGLMADPRLNQHHAVHRHHQLDVDPRQLAGAGGAMSYSDKTSSAFSPIQAAQGMLNTSAGFPMTGSRNYFYDTLSFPKHHSQVIMPTFPQKHAPTIRYAQMECSTYST
jgi:hypothetical protein